MSNKEISRYLTKEDGTTFSSDTELLGLSVNSKVKNKNSGYTFKKTSSNVFDKTPIEVETNAVLYTSQTLTDEQKTQARNNIGAGKSESVLYTEQTLTDAQKTQARNNIGAGKSESVLYTPQTLTDEQKNQVRTNIGAGKAESVLYTEQSLTDAQKLQARSNIGISDLSGVPLGTIVIWSGNASSIPTGWHICDGNAGTPDLRQKFVLGAGGVYPLNSSGGAVDHFHFFGRHTGDNSGSFYVCGELHNDSEGTNTAKGVNVKSPTKEALLSALNFGTSSAVIIEDEIGPKTAMWNGDNGGGISDHDKFTRGNMITSRGYAAGVTATEADCMPPYYVLYYIMKITGSGSTASGGTAASASQVETLSNLITQLQARISVLESSGTGSSSSGGTFTLGNEFTATIVSIGAPSDPIPVGTIITPNMYHQGDGQSYGGSSQTQGRWVIYQGTSTGANGNRLASGSYVVTQQSTRSGTTVDSGDVPYGQYIHTLKLRKITGVNV